MTGTAAIRAFLRRALQHAGADTLPRHFEQAEVRDAADLDARTIVLEALFQLALDRTVVAILVHVDEIDDDETGQVAQPKLTGDFVRGFEIGLERGVLDVVLA